MRSQGAVDSLASHAARVSAVQCGLPAAQALLRRQRDQ